MNKIGSDISSSEDELLTGGGNNYSPIESADLKNEFRNAEKDDDQMSLSSLSSNEKIEESKPEPPPLPPSAPPPQHVTNTLVPSVPPPPVPGIYPPTQHYPPVPHYPGQYSYLLSYKNSFFL